MTDRANCEGCPTGGNVAPNAKNRVANELGITCFEASRSKTNVNMPRTRGYAPSTTETLRTRVSCHLVYALEGYLNQNGVNYMARDRLVTLILSGAIADELPLGEAVQAVAQGQEDPKYNHADETTEKVVIDVDAILTDVAIPLENVKVQPYVNGLGERTAEFV